MRTLHLGLRVADLERSIAFYTCIGYDVLWAVAATELRTHAEAIFLAGNGFRVAQAIEELELRTCRLVVEADQALFWGILAATGTDWGLGGHGRLLRARRSRSSTSDLRPNGNCR